MWNIVFPVVWQRPTLPVNICRLLPFPNDPWDQGSIDFSELAGHYALIVIEDSRFPDIEIVDSTSAKTVIPWESPIMTPPLMVL